MFQADNFSRTEILFKSTDSTAPILVALIRSHFPGWKIVEAYQLDRNEINSGNYKILLESPTHEKKEVLVREYRVLKEISQIDFYLKFLAELREQGVRVSEICPTTDGALLAQAGELVYAVFAFIDATHFRPTEEGLASVAQEVAKMHQAFAALESTYRDRMEAFSKQGATFFNSVPQVLASDIDRIQEALEQKKERTETDALVLSKLPLYRETAEQIERIRTTAAMYPKQIFHSDLHPHNILMRKDVEEVEALVDFDSTRVQPLGRALDVAYAIYRLGKQFLVGQHGSPEELQQRTGELRKLFIDQYTAVHPLSDEELKLLPLLCKEEMLKKLVYLLKGAYLEQKTPWLHDLPKFIPAIDEINCFWA